MDIGIYICGYIERGKFVVNLTSLYGLNYWSFRSPCRREDDGVKELEGGNRSFTPLRAPLFRVHEKLGQHPSNNISIGMIM